MVLYLYTNYLKKYKIGEKLLTKTTHCENHVLHTAYISLTNTIVILYSYSVGRKNKKIVFRFLLTLV